MDTTGLKIRQIEAFRAVMLRRTVTSAAESLHVSQPAVSRLLADLESRVGFVLFERQQGRLVPTAEARVLFEEELARAGLATPVNLTECASIFATLQLLENYDAVAMLPESVVRDHLRGKLLVALPLEIGKSLAGFGILTRKEEPLAEPALRFIELLRGFSRRLTRDGGTTSTLAANASAPVS